MATCSAADCHKSARARGMCTAHYQAARRAGVLLPREPALALSLRVPRSTGIALLAEAKRTRESIYAVALRWLAERAEK